MDMKQIHDCIRDKWVDAKDQAAALKKQIVEVVEGGYTPYGIRKAVTAFATELEFSLMLARRLEPVDIDAIKQSCRGLEWSVNETWDRGDSMEFHLAAKKCLDFFYDLLLDAGETID